MKCRNCGAEIGANSKFCESCGSQISYDMRREQEQLNKKGCPQCGSSSVQFNREKQGEIKDRNKKQTIIRTVGICKDCGYTWYPAGDSKPPEKNNTIWWVLGWIFFFPVPVMVLIWRKKNTWDIKVKIGVTLAFWLFFFVIGSTNNSTEKTPPNSTPVVETSVDEQTVGTKEEPTDGTVVPPDYSVIDKCFEELSANNTANNYNDFLKQVRELADKYSLYYDEKNTGLGVRFMKIASTRDEASLISNADLDKGTYYIRIVVDYTKGSPDIQLINNLNVEETGTEIASQIKPIDLICIHDHPVYFDEIAKAKEVWKNYLDKEVCLSSNIAHVDEALIVVTAYGTNNTIIDYIKINLSNTSEKIELDEALSIAKSYLPVDLMKNDYAYVGSYVLTWRNIAAHIVHYKITEEGYKKREKTRDGSVYTMPYEIYVWLEGSSIENSVDFIRIKGSIDNAYWESNYINNGIERHDWHYNFFE